MRKKTSKTKQKGLRSAHQDSYLLHTQVRVGKKKKFGNGMQHAKIRQKSTAIRISKFRTKKKDALLKRKDGKDAQRDTTLQKIFQLREKKRDEIPQIIDVLTGKLRPVGIRPLLREHYRELHPRLKKIYDEMGPGLLGLKYACKNQPPTEQEWIETAEAFYKIWKRQPEKANAVYAVKILKNLRKMKGRQIAQEEIKEKATKTVQRKNLR